MELLLKTNNKKNMTQKTVINKLIEIMNEDQVSFTEWFIENCHLFIEKEKEQIISAYMADMYPCSYEDAEQYYNETYGTPQ